MPFLSLAQVIETPTDSETAKLVLYRSREQDTGNLVFEGGAVVLDPTLSAICSAHWVIDPKKHNAKRNLAHLVYLAAVETGLPDNEDEFSSYFITPRDIGTKLNRAIMDQFEVRPYDAPEAEKLIQKAYGAWNDDNISLFHFWDETNPLTYIGWNRSDPDVHQLQNNSSLEVLNGDETACILYHTPWGLCRVLVINPTTLSRLYHFEIPDDRSSILHTLTGKGDNNANLMNSYLISKPLGPKQLVHPSELPDDAKAMPDLLRSEAFKPYSLVTVNHYRTVLRFAGND